MNGSERPRGRHPAWRLAEPRVRIAPSLLAADFARLAEEVARVEAGGAEILHLDIMDGHFVPNLSFGIPVIRKLRPRTRLYFDTHLMITEPARYAEAFVDAGSNHLTFHVEVAQPAPEVIERIRSLGASVGITLNPGTPVAAIRPVVDQVDLVLVMSVWPGFGGQTFIPESLDRAREVRTWLRPDQRLEMDGGIGRDTIQAAARAGVDTFVAGTAVFGQADPAAAMNELSRLAAEAAGGSLSL